MQRNPRGTKVVDIFAGGRIQQFRVDFSNMEETCLTNKKVTPVDRCMKKAETCEYYLWCWNSDRATSIA